MQIFEKKIIQMLLIDELALNSKTSTDNCHDKLPEMPT